MIVGILRLIGAASRRVAAGLPIPKIVKGYLYDFSQFRSEAVSAAFVEWNIRAPARSTTAKSRIANSRVHGHWGQVTLKTQAFPFRKCLRICALLLMPHHRQDQRLGFTIFNRKRRSHSGRNQQYDRAIDQLINNVFFIREGGGNELGNAYVDAYLFGTLRWRSGDTFTATTLLLRSSGTRPGMGYRG